MLRWFNVVSLFILFISCESQSVERVDKYQEQEGVQILSQDNSWEVDRTPKGYSIVLPEDEILGTIIFLMSSPVTDQTEELNCVSKAIEQKLAVVFISTGFPADFMFTAQDGERVWGETKHVLQEYKLNEKPFVLAGLSLAGTRALKLTEYLLSNELMKPAGVILVDAPLDMERFWLSNERVKVFNKNEIAVNAAQWINAMLEKNLGGKPTESPTMYQSYSPFSYRLMDEKKLAMYLDIPIVAWHEEYVDWWMTNRSKDYYGTNSLDLAAFINELTLRGHQNATLMTTHDQTQLKSLATPHSWLIVDPLKFIEQSVAMIKSY
jgi:hypothetical protein